MPCYWRHIILYWALVTDKSYLPEWSKNRREGHFVGGAEIQDPRPSVYNIRVLVVGVEWSACVETCYSRSPTAKLPSATSITADRSSAARKQFARSVRCHQYCFCRQPAWVVGYMLILKPLASVAA